jgi:rubrerythrin
MADRSSTTYESGSLLEQLGALLEYDRRAVAAYTLAAERLRGTELRRRVQHFREDHERHIEELTRLMRAYGGGSSGRSGGFGVSGNGHDEGAEDGESFTTERPILRALKTLSRQGRDAYRLATCGGFPAEVSAVLRRAANDETIHYAWALEMLDDLDADRSRLRRSVGVALDEGGARLTDLVEVVERRSTSAVEKVREGVCAELGAHPMRAAIVAVGVGVCAATLTRGRAEGR